MSYLIASDLELVCLTRVPGSPLTWFMLFGVSLLLPFRQGHGRW